MSADEQDELLQDEDEIMSADEYEQPDGSEELQHELEQELDDEDGDKTTEQVQKQEEEEEEEIEGGEIEPDNSKEERGTKQGANDAQDDASMPAYIIFNRSAYGIPLAGNGSDSGRVRDHGQVIVVENDTVLGQLNNAKSWPPATSIPPIAIVVVKGRHDENQKIPTNKEHGMFHWYARVVSAENQNSEDRNILRPIPKQVVIDILKSLAKNDSMKKSSLITHYQPFENNKQVFPMQPNDWMKVPGIRSTAKARTAIKKKVAMAQDAEEDAMETTENEKSTKRPNPETAVDSENSEKRSKVEKDDTNDKSKSEEDKKAKQAAASHTPSSEEKKPVKTEKPESKKVKQNENKTSSEMKGSVKKGSMLEFTRVSKQSNGASTSSAAAASPTSQRSSLVPRSPIQSRSPAKARSRTAPSASAPSPSPAPAPSPAQAPAPALASASASAPFRCLTKVSTHNKEKVHLFWDGNDLWVGEMN